MAQGSNYKVPFRRRREGKTDYAARMKLVDYDKSRLVVRLSNAHATVQVIDYAPEGDITLASAVSKQLANYGYLGGASNTSAVYLTAYLCAKRALAKGIDSAILDIGLKSAIKGSKVFAALKGAVDAGLDIPYGEAVLPDESRINGEHVANYAESLDDDEIANIAQQYGAKVPFMRSADTANDYATTSDVINEVISYYHERNQAFDIISCIYATAPFITKDILKKAYQEMQESRYDSIFPIVAFSYPIQRSLILDSFKRVKMREPQFVNSRSQDLQTIYHDAGQFYIATWQSFCKYNDFWGENTGAMILNELEVQDLDTEIDWQLAEMKYQLMKK